MFIDLVSVRLFMFRYFLGIIKIEIIYFIVGNSCARKVINFGIDTSPITLKSEMLMQLSPKVIVENF